MGIYEALGVPTLVNCAGTYTIVGGSKMSAGSLEAIRQAAESHVKIAQLQEKVHEKIAELTQNEAAIVTAGAIVGIYLSAASCISLKYKKAFKLLRKEEIARSEIIMFRAHRNAYDRGVELTGAHLVEVGYPNNINMISEEEFENAFTEHTAGVIYLPSTDGGWVPPGALEIQKTIATCKKHSVPIIIDAAAQLPPKSNLWSFTKNMGATAVVFSGGKYLHGPQTTGLVLGEKRLIEWMWQNSFPNYGIGRMHKVGREELAGIYTAVKEYVALDEEATDRAAEKIVALFVDRFSGGGRFYFQRTYPNEAGQPMARAKMYLTDPGLTAKQVQAKLENLPRAIFTIVENGHIYINPMMMTEEEADYVAGVLAQINSEV